MKNYSSFPYRDIIKNYKSSGDSFYDIGFKYAGPILFIYVWWVLLEAQKKNIAHIIKNLEYNKGLGIVFPKSFQILEEATHWSLNRNIAEKLLKKMNIDIMLPVNNIVFPVGNMFWARVDAILPFFTYIQMSDFPKKRGQINGTIAHAIERPWVYVVEHN